MTLRSSDLAQWEKGPSFPQDLQSESCSTCQLVKIPVVFTWSLMTAESECLQKHKLFPHLPYPIKTMTSDDNSNSDSKPYIYKPIAFYSNEISVFVL